MALAQTAYARSAHAVHASDRSMPPWEDRRNSQFGLSMTPTGATPVAESKASLPVSAPSLRGTASELRTRNALNMAARRPNLRGAIARAATATQESPQEVEWSATADPSPAQQDTRSDEQIVSDTPTLGVPVSDIMQELARQFDLNVEEADRIEWLISTGLLPTVGQVFDMCEAQNYPRRPETLVNTTSALGVHAMDTPPGLPMSWHDEDTCPAEPALPPPHSCPVLAAANGSALTPLQRRCIHLATQEVRAQY